MDMKTRTLNMIALLIGALLLACASAQAQVSSTTKTDIPFDFAVGNRMLRAGEYKIRRTSDSQIMAVISSEQKTEVFVLAVEKIESTGSPSIKLVFHRYGNSYFLSEVWSGGDSGVRIAPSKAERYAANQLPQGNREPKVVEVALRK
jgi:hypothetical protein